MTGQHTSPPYPVAVIVPVRNEQAILPRLIEQLARLPVTTCLLVDGDSEDSTPSLLAEASARWPLRVLTAPRGRARQMNAGAAACDDPILLFLHADTVLLPAHIAQVQKAIAQGADFGCFRVRLDSCDPRMRLIGSLISLRSRLMTSATGDQAIFMRRTLFQSLGGYRPLALCEDLDLIARAAPRARFVCLDAEVVTSARRWQRHGVLRTVLLMWFIRLACHLGVDPQQLQRLYHDARERSTP